MLQSFLFDRPAKSLALVAVATLTGAAHAASVFTDLNASATTSAYGFGINDPGQVAGYYNSSTNIPVAYLFTPGTGAATIGTASTSSGTDQAYAVNANGLAVGTYDFGGGVTNAFYSVSGATPVRIGTLRAANAGSSTAFAVNKNGLIVGQSSALVGTTTYTHAFTYTAAGGIVDLTPTLATNSQATSVNDSGVAVGYVNAGTPLTQHAAIFSGGSVTDFHPAADAYSVARGVNASGTVVGYYGVTSSSGNQAFKYSGGTFTTLTPAGSATLDYAQKVDDGGDAVGYSYTTSSNHRATLWVNGTTAGVDLNTYFATVDPTDAARYVLTEATAISPTTGLVTGIATLTTTGGTTQTRAYELDISSLIPEPASLTVLALGGIGMLRRRTSRR